MAAVPPDELKRRVRAAWAYSGLEQAELAERAHVNPRTLGGYMGLSRPNVPGPEARRAIAKACGVPVSFMEEGFARFSDGDDALQGLQRRVDAIAVLLPLLLELSGGQERLPPAGAQALARVLELREPEDHRRPA